VRSQQEAPDQRESKSVAGTITRSGGITQLLGHTKLVAVMYSMHALTGMKLYAFCWNLQL